MKRANWRSRAGWTLPRRGAGTARCASRRSSCACWDRTSGGWRSWTIRDLVDVLHRALLLWEKGKRADLVQTLVAGGRSEVFYRVAQAISETLPVESREKKLLDGFLAGRERLRAEVEQTAAQMRMDF